MPRWIGDLLLIIYYIMKRFIYVIAVLIGAMIGLMWEGFATPTQQKIENCAYDIIMESGAEIPSRLAVKYCTCIVAELEAMQKEWKMPLDQSTKTIVDTCFGADL